MSSPVRTGLGVWRQRIMCGFPDLWPREMFTGMIWPFAFAFDGTTLHLIRANRIDLMVELRRMSMELIP